MTQDQIVVDSNLQEIQADAAVYGGQCPCVFGFSYDPNCGSSCSWERFYPDSIEVEQQQEELKQRVEELEMKYPTYFHRDDSVFVTPEDTEYQVRAMVAAKLVEICIREKISDGQHVLHLLNTLLEETFEAYDHLCDAMQ